MDLSSLTDLSVLPLRISARVREPAQLPTFAGSSLRGAFGSALKELVCVERERTTCIGCSVQPRCTYPTLFEPRATPEQAGLSGFQDLPRPYVIRCDVGERQIQPGDRFTWEVTLIGRGIEELPYFVLAWRNMGHQGLGRGRGRFDLERVESLAPHGAGTEVLYDERTNRLRPPETLVTGALLSASLGNQPVSEIALCFQSPTLVKYQGRFAETPHFAALWHSLQLRLSTLRLAHGAGRPLVDFRASLDAAQQIELVEWEATTVSWNRYSNRQDRRIPMRGWMGVALYRGKLTSFLPALAMGSFVGVGDNCTFGQGRYSLSSLKSEPL